MSAKLPEPKKPLRETIREHWSDKLELGGSKDGYVACYAANQVLGTVWRGSNESLGLHQAARAAEPGEPARDPGRQQAGAGVREKEGDHVRDEQAFGAAPEVNASQPEALAGRADKRSISPHLPAIPPPYYRSKIGKLGHRR